MRRRYPGNRPGELNSSGVCAPFFRRGALILVKSDACSWHVFSQYRIDVASYIFYPQFTPFFMGTFRFPKVGSVEEVIVISEEGLWQRGVLIVFWFRLFHVISAYF